MAIYEKDFTSMISFPLGGIGTGSIGLAGNGHLVDWEIFNAPNKGSLNGKTHFAVRAEKNGKIIDARILQGDILPPFLGTGGERLFKGFGWGPSVDTLCGIPSFEKHVFKGEYPIACIEFEDKGFPGQAKLHAWSPFIPGNSYDSSIPAACFEIEICNNTDEDMNYSIVAVLANPFSEETAFNSYKKDNSLHQLTVSRGGDKNDFEYGDLTLSCSENDVSYQEYWHRGYCRDNFEVYWHEMLNCINFKNRHYEKRKGELKQVDKTDTGLLANHFKLKTGEAKKVNFVISWNIPNRKNDWNDKADEMAKANGLENKWRNWYATQWEDSLASGAYAMKNYEQLSKETRLFKDTLFNSTFPEVILEGISANMSILKTATCLRLEDGTFYGWEGIGKSKASCEGSCTHVWNYAQALPFLFPDLERSMRTANYNFNIDDNGGAHFRIMLPLGIKADTSFRRPCVDGQFGDVMKAYRDWKICGDNQWLDSLWPEIKRTIEYAWSDKNYDRWDPAKSGVITGRQHHTLDMELFGPSSWLNGHYLGALKAASEMGKICRDSEFANECAEIFERGKKWTNENLFNGEYFYQQIDLSDKEQLMQFDRNEDDSAVEIYWNDEFQQVKYQVADGCEIDMTLPQWYATIYGLGEILEADKCRKTLQAIYKNNFQPNMRKVTNQWRLYCLNEEAGLQMCTWPNNNKPILPLTHASETMHGFEWAAAAQMLIYGMYDEGMNVIKGIRDRYDGRKRNPWNEFECGNNYARSMASYGLLNSLSGFSFDLCKGHIVFSPLMNNKDFQSFWSLGSCWGNFKQNSDEAKFELLYGELALNSISLNFTPARIKLGSQDLSFKTKNGNIELGTTLFLKEATEVTFIKPTS